MTEEAERTLVLGLWLAGWALSPFTKFWKLGAKITHLPLLPSRELRRKGHFSGQRPSELISFYNEEDRQTTKETKVLLDST